MIIRTRAESHLSLLALELIPSVGNDNPVGGTTKVRVKGLHDFLRGEATRTVEIPHLLLLRGMGDGAGGYLERFGSAGVQVLDLRLVRTGQSDSPYASGVRGVVQSWPSLPRQ